MHTKHHKYPRHPAYEDTNVVYVDDKEHRLWHMVWQNRTPQGILKAINALQELFGDVKISEIKEIIKIKWIP